MYKVHAACTASLRHLQCAHNQLTPAPAQVPCLDSAHCQLTTPAAAPAPDQRRRQSQTRAQPAHSQHQHPGPTPSSERTAHSTSTSTDTLSKARVASSFLFEVRTAIAIAIWEKRVQVLFQQVPRSFDIHLPELKQVGPAMFLQPKPPVV